MTREQILINNKLICEFMGVKPKQVENLYFWSHAPFMYVSERKEEYAMDAIVKYVKYNTSFEWLMPVVEQIRQTAGVCTIEDSKEKQFAFKLFTLNITTPIKTVYMYVMNYINWYNTQTNI